MFYQIPTKRLLPIFQIFVDIIVCRYPLASTAGSQTLPGPGRAACAPPELTGALLYLLSPVRRQLRPPEVGPGPQSSHPGWTSVQQRPRLAPEAGKLEAPERQQEDPGSASGHSPRQAPSRSRAWLRYWDATSREESHSLRWPLSRCAKVGRRERSWLHKYESWLIVDKEIKSTACAVVLHHINQNGAQQWTTKDKPAQGGGVSAVTKIPIGHCKLRPGSYDARFSSFYVFCILLIQGATEAHRCHTWRK